MDGVFMAMGPQFQKGRQVSNARLVDLPPTILHLLDVAVPTVMDGTVLEQCLDPNYVSGHPVKTNEWTGELAAARFRYSETEEEEIKDRLEGMGYL